MQNISSVRCFGAIEIRQRWSHLAVLRCRKDALLQEQGYIVLRFLAEDVGTKLDMVLDAILGMLSSRTCGKLKE
jgi:very-short-patch-repair endonuclease